MQNGIDDFEFELDEHCTEDNWKAFFSTMCWKEFCDTLKMRLSITRTELENEVIKEDIYKLQGDARTLRYVLALEEIILSEAKIKEKEIEDGRE
jgi:hypothetical protein